MVSVSPRWGIVFVFPIYGAPFIFPIKVEKCDFFLAFGKRFPLCGVYHYESASEMV